MSSRAIDLVRRAKELLAEAAGLDTFSLTDEQTCELVIASEETGRYLDAIRVAGAGEIEHRSGFELGSAGLSYRHGQRRGVDLVEQLTRVSKAEAARRVRLGMVIRPRVSFVGELLLADHPWVAAAVCSGQMDTGAASTAVRILDQAARHHAQPDDLTAAEQALVVSAASKSADLVVFEARVWRDALDPDGVLPREEALRQQRSFRLHRPKPNGMVPFSGEAPPADAAYLQAAMEESSNPDASPRFLSDEDRDRGTQTITTPEGESIVFTDPRSREERNFDTFLSLVIAGLRNPDAVPTPLGTVMVTVAATDLASGRGVAWIDGIDEPVSISTVEEMICDVGYYEAILSGEYEALAEGLRQRFFTRRQRRMLAVRDGGCVWPGCTAPPSWCEAHHVIEWHQGGPTDLDNGVLLCRAHHHMLHTTDYQLHMIGGRPHLLAPTFIDPTQTWHKLGHARHELTRELRRAS